MPGHLRILLAEDNEDDALLIVREIRKAGYRVDFLRVETATEMAAAYDGDAWDVIISDVNMPSFGAEHALALVKQRGGDMPFIVVSGVIGEELAVGLLKSGAHDFILKTRLARLVPAIERECRESEARRARRAAEEALRAAKEDLEHALAAKTRFLAAASHDLRQPFQSMRLYQHMLAEAVVEPLHRKIVAHLGEAMASGEALLHALLDVSTLDAGIIPVHAADIRPRDIASQVAREFEQEAAARRIRLTVIGQDGCIHSDPTLLARMLRNLISNALRYTEPGGRVLVACRRAGESMRLQVCDTGIGIPEDMQAAVFEDFVQVGNPERDRRHGLGLGLSIIRRTAQLLGCHVSLRSRLGVGSVFTLSFPRVTPADAAGPRQPARLATRPRRAARLWVLEDDEMQLKALTLLLEGWGYEVLAASRPEALLAAVAPQPPDAILSDFRLPGPLTGLQVVETLWRRAGRPIAAVIMTGDTAPAPLRQAAGMGCRLLHKPYDPALLKATIEDILPAARPDDRWHGAGFPG